MLASNSLETPVLGLVGARRRGPLRRRGDRTIGWRARRCRAARRGLGLEDELAVLGSFVAGPEALRALRRRRRRQHRRSSGRGVPRAAHHLRARFAAARPADRAAATSCPIEPRRADRRQRPTRPGRAAWPPTGWRAIASSSRAATCARRRACRTCWRRCASRCSRCCASVRTFVPRTIRCCAMATRARALGRRAARARCSPSWRSSSPRAPRRPRGARARRRPADTEPGMRACASEIGDAPTSERVA